VVVSVSQKPSAATAMTIASARGDAPAIPPITAAADAAETDHFLISRQSALCLLSRSWRK